MYIIIVELELFSPFLEAYARRDEHRSGMACTTQLRQSHTDHDLHTPSSGRSLTAYLHDMFQAEICRETGQCPPIQLLVPSQAVYIVTQRCLSESRTPPKPITTNT